MAEASHKDALFLAAKSGSAEDVEELLKLGVDPSVTDHLGNTPLHYSAGAGHTAVVARLVAHPKSQVNKPNNMGDTPLHKAAWRGSAETVKVLVSSGADLNAKNNNGERPVQIAKNSEIGSLVQPASEGDMFYEDDEEEGGGSDSD
jgi:ankyrin repeat protein